jgi:hypothetical protein
MDKIACTIGCKSNQTNLPKMLSSMIRVYNGFSASQLKYAWNFTAQTDVLDVCIIDLDDEQHQHYLDTAQQYQGIITVGKTSYSNKKYKYHLTKPIHNSELLHILKQLELDELRHFAKQKTVAKMPATPTTELPEQTASPQHALHYQLINWPDLSQIPSDLLPNTSRVCALLAAKAQSFHHIVEFLNIPHEELSRIIHALDTYAFAMYPSVQSIEMTTTLPATPQATTSSFLGKIWGRLKNTH